jgi:hypothetical protein
MTPGATTGIMTETGMIGGTGTIAGTASGTTGAGATGSRVVFLDGRQKK